VAERGLLARSSEQSSFSNLFLDNKLHFYIKGFIHKTKLIFARFTKSDHFEVSSCEDGSICGSRDCRFVCNMHIDEALCVFSPAGNIIYRHYCLESHSNRLFHLSGKEFTLEWL